MKWLLYDFLFGIVYLAMLPKFLMRMRRRGGYSERLSDRFGRFPDSIKQKLSAGTGFIWIHAVSVGEVYVAGQFMREFRTQTPGTKFVLSTTSSTGWKEAQKQVAEDDVLIYCPLDFRPCVRRALDLIQPKALILTESEIWPNLLRMSAKRNIPLFLVNARVSDRSAPRYKKFRFWFGPVLNLFHQIYAQSEMDKERLVDAGANPKQIEVIGSVKYDTAIRNPAKEAEIAQWLQRGGISADESVLLGGSTWPGEDEVLLAIYKSLRKRFEKLRLVIVPRHFEKADAVEAAVLKAGFPCIRKSVTPEPKPDPDAVFLGDTTGELMGFYGNATFVFVGKSLCEHGSQNMIEPCLCGAVTFVGPNTENFRSVVQDLLDARALIQVQDGTDLESNLSMLLEYPEQCDEFIDAAQTFIEKRKGVVPACVKTIRERL